MRQQQQEQQHCSAGGKYGTRSAQSAACISDTVQSVLHLTRFRIWNPVFNPCDCVGVLVFDDMVSWQYCRPAACTNHTPSSVPAPCSCSVPSAVSALRSSCQSALSSLRMPSTRNEEYRYTDISSLLNSALAVAPADAAVNSEQLQQLAVPEAAGSRVVLVNGTFRPELSDLSAVGEGVYVGGAAGAPADVLQQLVSALSAVRSSFAALCLRTSVAWHGMAAECITDSASWRHVSKGPPHPFSARAASGLLCIGWA